MKGEFLPFAFGGLLIAVVLWWFFIRKKGPPLVKNVYVNGPAVSPNLDADLQAKKLHEAMTRWTLKTLHYLSYLAAPAGIVGELNGDSQALNDVWQWLYNQDNATTKVVYYTFNSHYDNADEGKKTLTKWIEETKAPMSSMGIQKKLLAKLRALKLY